MDTLKELIAKIKQATKEGKFWDENPANADTVFFWAQQVSESLKQPVSSKESLLIKEAFGNFLVPIIIDNPVYQWFRCVDPVAVRA